MFDQPGGILGGRREQADADAAADEHWRPLDIERRGRTIDSAASWATTAAAVNPAAAGSRIPSPPMPRHAFCSRTSRDAAGHGCCSNMSPAWWPRRTVHGLKRSRLMNSNCRLVIVSSAASGAPGEAGAEQAAVRQEVWVSAS